MPVRAQRPSTLPAVEVTAYFSGPTEGTARRLLAGLVAPAIIGTPRGEVGYLLRAHLHQGRVIGWRLVVCDPDREDNGTTYDLPCESAHPTCECKDFLTRSHRRVGGLCKHLIGLNQLLEQIGLSA